MFDNSLKNFFRDSLRSNKSKNKRIYPLNSSKENLIDDDKESHKG